jgi:hypothetical protein
VHERDHAVDVGIVVEDAGALDLFKGAVGWKDLLRAGER